MSLKMKVNRLAKDDLEYELKIKAFTDMGCIQKIRECIRNVSIFEQVNDSLTYPVYDLKFQEKS